MLKDLEVVENNNSAEWTPEVVYTVYRNDNLKELPTSILKDMIKHIQNTINTKEE